MPRSTAVTKAGSSGWLFKLTHYPALDPGISKNGERAQYGAERAQQINQFVKGQNKLLFVQDDAELRIHIRRETGRASITSLPVIARG